MKQQLKTLLPIISAFSILSVSTASIAKGNKTINIDRIAAADINKDGIISKQEIKNYKALSFSKLDRNKDNFVSIDDIPKFVAKSEQKASLSELIRMNDLNGDQRLSYQEFVNGRNLALEAFDANNDGTLDQYEIQKAKQFKMK